MATKTQTPVDDFLDEVAIEPTTPTGVTWRLNMTAVDRIGYGLNVEAVGFTSMDDACAAARALSLQWEEEGAKPRASERSYSSGGAASDGGSSSGGGKSEDLCDQCGVEQVSGWKTPEGTFLSGLQMARSARRKGRQALCKTCKFGK